MAVKKKKATFWEFFQGLGKTFMLPVALLAFMGKARSENYFPIYVDNWWFCVCLFTCHVCNGHSVGVSSERKRNCCVFRFRRLYGDEFSD